MNLNKVKPVIQTSHNLCKPVLVSDPDLTILHDSAIRTAERKDVLVNAEKPTKDRVSLRYSSKFLLSIREKGNFFLPSNLVLMTQKNLKNFNFSKLLPKKSDFSAQKPIVHLTNSNKVENKPLKQARKLRSVCSKKSPPSSPEYKADSSFSENVHLCGNVSQVLPSPNENANSLYCNANNHPKKGGGVGLEKSLLSFKGCENTEVIKTSSGGKGRASVTTSDMDSFCLSTVAHMESFSCGQSNMPINACQKPKVRVVCESCRNPILGLINDHTYAKDGVGKIFQQYKFIKTNSKSDVGKLKIFSLNVGGSKVNSSPMSWKKKCQIMTLFASLKLRWILLMWECSNQILISLPFSQI